MADTGTSELKVKDPFVGRAALKGVSLRNFAIWLCGGTVVVPELVVLPDGSVGSSIIKGAGFMDPGTTRGLINEVLLGSIVRGQ